MTGPRRQESEDFTSSPCEASLDVVMSIPSPMQVFESGLSPTPPAAPTAGFFDALIREKLEAAQRIIMTSDTSSSVSLQSRETNSLLDEMGDYMNRVALISAKLAESLVSGEHIDHAAMDLHMKAQRDTHLADLSSVAAFGVQLDRLR